MARYFKFPEELKDYDFIGLYDKESNARLKIKYLALSYLKEGKPLMGSVKFNLCWLFNYSNMGV